MLGKKVSATLYRASHVLVDLGWVDLDLGSSPGWWAATYCSYLLPEQGGGTSQIQVNKIQSTRTWDALYTYNVEVLP